MQFSQYFLDSANYDKIKSSKQTFENSIAQQVQANSSYYVSTDTFFCFKCFLRKAYSVRRFEGFFFIEDSSSPCRDFMNELYRSSKKLKVLFAFFDSAERNENKIVHSFFKPLSISIHLLTDLIKYTLLVGLFSNNVCFTSTTTPIVRAYSNGSIFIKQTELSRCSQYSSFVLHLSQFVSTSKKLFSTSLIKLVYLTFLKTFHFHFQFRRNLLAACTPVLDSSNVN